MGICRSECQHDFSPSRLSVDIRFYGMCGTGVSGVRQSAGVEIADDNSLSYENIMTQYYSASRHQYDPAAMAPSLSSATAFGPAAGAKCNFVSYEDPTSVTAKGNFALQKKLGGTIIWTIGEGHQSELPAGQRDPLLEAVSAAFRP
jgi:chitinase